MWQLVSYLRFVVWLYNAVYDLVIISCMCDGCLTLDVLCCGECICYPLVSLLNNRRIYGEG